MKNHLMIQPTNKSSAGWLSKAVLTGVLSSLMMTAAHAQIETVFYVLLENRCLSSGTDKNYTNVIYGNSAAPYLNALMTPGNTLAANSSWCSCYHHVNSKTSGDNVAQTGSTSNGTGAGGSIHPSEPNYIFMEAGSNLSKYDDTDPYAAGTPSVSQIATYLSLNPSISGENFSGLLQNAGITWKTYQEGTNLLTTTGQNVNFATTGTLTNTIAPVGSRTVPLSSISGAPTTYTNPINGTHQYNFAAKHCGTLFFTATNGSTVTTANTSTSNVAVSHYGPLEDLDTDLANNTVAAYNVITPDQFNDGHTALSGTWTYASTAANGHIGTGLGYSGDIARIAQMDNCCAVLVNKIVNSAWYSAASPAGGTNGSHTAIVLWTDETEGSSLDDYYHTLVENVISPLCKGNAYNSTLNYTHSSDINTFQKVFGVVANTPTGFLNDAANASQPTVGTATTNTGQGLVPSTGQPFQGYGTGTAYDLSDLFVPGTIPTGLPGLNLTPSGFAFNRTTHSDSQTVTVTNVLSTAISNPIYLVVGSLSSNTSLTNSLGMTVNTLPGSPYISVSPSGLAAGASITVTLKFTAPTTGVISETLSAINTAGTP